MKILSAAQIRELDAYTIEHEPVSSIDLMERASQAFTDWFVKKFDTSHPVKVFCGPGNNGGDGFAIARMLLKKSYQVEVYAPFSEKKSADCKVNEERYALLKKINYLRELFDFPLIERDTILIDALFGSGLSKPLEGLYAEAVRNINASGALVISVDIASGLFVDSQNEDENIVRPAYTLSFQLPKLSFLLPQNAVYTGEWHLLDIGLSAEFLDSIISDYFFSDEAYVKSLIRKREKFSHKGSFGKALIVAGSFGMMGAAVLAVKSCLRAGVGLVKAHVPRCGYEIMQTAVPEAMVLTDPSLDSITDISSSEGYSAIGLGPGFSEGKASAEALEKFLRSCNVPVVLDAGALNILSKERSLLKLIPAGSILTPHPGEFERLAGKSENDYHRLELLKNFAKEYNCYVVLKGAYTAIARPEGIVCFNSTGNPGMATAGSGDVLTGIITGLLAQGYSSLHAAVLGVYIHGYAGDLAAERLSEPALIASDILDEISEVYKILYQK